MLIFFFLLFFLIFIYSVSLRSVFFNCYLSFLFSVILFLYASIKILHFNTRILFDKTFLSSLVDVRDGLIDFCYIQVDGIALTLIWLTTFVTLLCLFYNYNVIGFSYAKYNFLLVAIECILVFSFLVKNLLAFYILFEMVLIPMFLLIGLGSRGRKAHAGHYFFFFTFVSSILLLLGVAFIYFKVGSLSFEIFPLATLSFSEQKIVFYLFFFGFLAKIPLMPLHIWLPEAHVEAPTVGSVILAAILLKLGAYGMFRVIFSFCNFEIFQEIKITIIPFIALSIVLPALIAVRQIDLKKVVAYSSVVHMSFGLLGLFSQHSNGVQGFLFLLISHGLISSAMFFCVGMLYDRFHTRNISYYGGLVQYMPIFSIFYFFIIFSNMSLPGTCNFVGEFFVLLAIVDSFGLLVSCFVLVGLFATVLFCLILLYKVVFYQVSGLLTYNLIDLNFIEFLILLFLSFYILLFGIFPNLLLCFFVF